MKKPAYLTFDFKVKTIKSSEFSNLIATTIGLGSSTNDFQGLKSKNTLRYPKVQLILLNYDESDNFGKYFNVINDTVIDYRTFGSKLDDNKPFPVSYSYLESFQNASQDLNNLKTICENSKALVVTIQVDVENDQIDKGVSQLMNKFYENCDFSDDDFLIYLLSTPSLRASRVERQIKDDSKEVISNPAVFYNPNYPVTFNIIFWTTLVLALAVFGAAYVVCSMDPGTDTVIYRMTTQRIKKDQ